ncbi:MAG: TonB-dependent receptor plug domain-containing protein [Runella sp.]
MKFRPLSILTVFISSAAFSQSALEVTVNSLLSKKNIANASVYLERVNTKLLDSSLTDAKGVASFKNLVAGERYRVFTKANALFEDAEVREIRLQNGLNRILLEPSLRREEILSEVVVSGSRAGRLNTQNAEVSSVVTKRELQSVPIEGRDVSRILMRLPNLTVSSLGYAEAPTVAINGLNGIYTNYLIDGMDNNERFLGNVKFNTPLGFTESIQVLTNNYSVEWGNTSNGVVNVTTRSGSNQLSGELFYLTRPGAVIDAKSPYPTLDLSGNQVKDGFQRHQLGFGLGGALKKDKTFFYINFEQTNDKKDNLLRVPALNVNEIVTGRNSFSYFSTKLDHNWSSSFKSSLRVNVGSFDIDRQGGGLEGGILFPSAASRQANRTYLVALKNNYQIRPNFTGETNLQRSMFRWNYRQPVNPTSPSVTVQDPSGVAIATIGQAGAIFDDVEQTFQIQQKFSLRVGRHALRMGAEMITSNFALLGGGNPYGTYTVRLNQAQLDALKARNLGSALDVNDIPRDVAVRTYDVELQTSTFGARQNVWSAYIEDAITVTNRLKFNFGLRYDYDNLSRSGDTKGDRNNLAPRLSFNYQLNDRTVIRGGYGLFYDKIKYSVYSDNLQFSSTSTDFKKQLAELQRLGLLDPNADLNRITFPGNIRATAPNVRYLEGPSYEQLQGRRNQQFNANLRVMNPNGWDNPYSHQYSVGIQHKPASDYIFGLDLVHIATNNLYYIRNLNPASPYRFQNDKDVKVRTVAQGDLTRPVPIRSDRNGFYAVAGRDTLRGIARNVFMTETKGIARYYSASATFQKLKGHDKYAYRLGYTLASIKSNTGGINTRAQDSNDFDFEYAYDNNDRRHVLNAMFAYYPWENLVISPAFMLQSGQPITRLADAKVFGTTDLNGDGESFGFASDLYPGERRNSDRLPWAKTLDISVRYTIMVKHKPRLEFEADVFNVLNTQNLSGFNATFGASNQFQLGPVGTPLVVRAAGPPRQFQFGLRYLL